MRGRIAFVGGLVADGNGGEPKLLDVVIEGKKIVQLVEHGKVDATRIIDCSGLLIAPGFIDIHAHSDLSRIAYPDAPTRSLQGITTEVIGNCGLSPAPLGENFEEFRTLLGPIDVVPTLAIHWKTMSEYFDQLDASPGSTNLAPLLGHGNLRYSVMGLSGGTATAKQCAQMVFKLDQALKLGYWGLSLGFMYAPGELSERQELNSLTAVLHKHGALLTCHMRGYDQTGLVAAVIEILDIAKSGRVPLEISHLRSINDDGSALERAIEIISASDVDVEADAYPYLAGHTTLLQLLSPEIRGRGVTEILKLIRSVPTQIAADFRGASSFDPAQISIAKAGESAAPEVGLTLAELVGKTEGEIRGIDWASIAVNLLDRYEGNVDVIVVGTRQMDANRVLQLDFVSVASDGLALDLNHFYNLPHPRSIGTFPRAFHELSLAGVATGEIIRKMTSKPARRIGIRDRGVIAENLIADICVLDVAKLWDNATYQKPLIPPSGIVHVMVSGQFVVFDSVPTGNRPGTLLRRSS
jgi:N-acyl-D-aspartate/D-glutamate deacylase